MVNKYKRPNIGPQLRPGSNQKDAARWRKFCEAFDKPMQRAWLAKGFGCHPDEFEPSMNAVVDAAMGAAPKGPK